jgi:Predicted divalent heavy-metal cations transporter
MSTAQTLLLGALAGCTIFIGLPVARIRNVPSSVRSMLAATATGILIFLLWDILAGAVDPVETALKAGRDGRFFWLATLLTVGFAGGLLPLVYYDGWMRKRRQQALLGPGAASEAEFGKSRSLIQLSPSHTLALFIATGIGLHNFSEGLAIGQSAAQGAVSLAVVLVIGFALHNATEGFGICAPLSGDVDPPSWAFLGVMGLIGGGPTFIGTLIGVSWVSEAMSVIFLALAGGSILYVIVELLNVLHGAGSKATVTWGILFGLILGFGTDFVLVAAGV